MKTFEGLVTLFSMALAVLTLNRAKGTLSRASHQKLILSTLATLAVLLWLSPRPAWAINFAPVANNDSRTMDEDRQLVVGAPGVLANDTDANGDPLTAILAVPPSHGTLTLNSNGSFTYRPNINFNGFDGFTYKASDGHRGISNVATVSIRVNPVNDTPVAQNLSITAKANFAKSITLVGTDVEGDPLSFRIETAPQHGTVSGTSPNLTYTPTSGFTGFDVFPYTVFDGAARSNAATVTINVLPEINILDATISEEDTDFPLQIVLSASTPQAVTVQLRLVDGTATREDDYDLWGLPITDIGSLTPIPASGFTTVTIPPNTLAMTPPDILIRSLGDPYCEPDETFYSQLSSPTNALIGHGIAEFVLLNDDFCFGTAAITPSEAGVRVGDRLNYSLTWTHPERWRLLETIDLRIRDDRGAIFYVRWNEPANTFSLIDPVSGKLGHAVAPGSPGRLETSAATLYLAESSVVGSGPTGPSVALNFSLSFKPQAAGRTYQVEAFATDDDGHQQGFEPVGTLAVSASQGAPSSGIAGSGLEPGSGLSGDVPLQFAARAFPNPVNRSPATISYAIPAGTTGSQVEISVIDIAGRLIRTLVSESRSAGEYTVNWDLRDESGSHVSSGIFFYRVRAGDQQTTGKLLVVGR